MTLDRILLDECDAADVPWHRVAVTVPEWGAAWRVAWPTFNDVIAWISEQDAVAAHQFTMDGAPVWVLVSREDTGWDE